MGHGGPGEDVHVGRSWRGTPVEDGCPCPQEPCGLVALSRVHLDCRRHGLADGRTIRQAHFAADCPARDGRAGL